MTLKRDIIAGFYDHNRSSVDIIWNFDIIVG